MVASRLIIDSQVGRSEPATALVTTCGKCPETSVDKRMISWKVSAQVHDQCAEGKQSVQEDERAATATGPQPESG